MNHHQHCPQCDQMQRVTEDKAFRGMSDMHSTLACGHLVARFAPTPCGENYGVTAHGVFFAKQQPTPEYITVAFVNATETDRWVRRFPNTTRGEADAVEWTLDRNRVTA